MTITADDILARLDHEHITEIASRAAFSLGVTGHALILLTPNDGTVYEIMVVRKGTQVIDRHLQTNAFYHWVALMNCSGKGYHWNGEHVEEGYVADKWVIDGRLWTAVVLTAFLNALSDHLHPSIGA